MRCSVIPVYKDSHKIKIPVLSFKLILIYFRNDALSICAVVILITSNLDV